MEFVKVFRSLRRGTPLYGLSSWGRPTSLQALGRRRRGHGITQVMPLPTNPVVPVCANSCRPENANMAQDRAPHRRWRATSLPARVFCEALQRAGKTPARQLHRRHLEPEKWDLGGFEVTPPSRAKRPRFVELTLVGRTDVRFMRRERPRLALAHPRPAPRPSPVPVVGL